MAASKPTDHLDAASQPYCCPSERAAHQPASKLEVVQKQMRAVQAQGLPVSDIKTFQLQLRLTYPELTERDIERLWNAIVEEQAQAEANADLLQNYLPTLLQVKRQRLVLADYLWGDKGRLAKQLTATAIAMPTAPEFLLTTLIAAAGSRLSAGTRISIKPSAGYTPYSACLLPGS